MNIFKIIFIFIIILNFIVNVSCDPNEQSLNSNSNENILNNDYNHSQANNNNNQVNNSNSNNSNQQNSNNINSANLNNTESNLNNLNSNLNSQTVDYNASCYRAEYTESITDPHTDISDIVRDYSSSNALDFALKALERRYPIGKYILLQAKDDPNCKQFINRLGRGVSEDLSELSTTVHECGHVLDITSAPYFISNTYIITNELRIEARGCSCGEKCNTADPDPSFSRSLITTDEYNNLRPGCAGGSYGSNCDTYASIYLNGDPDNSTFESGDQGLNMLIEELNQYINSLAVSYAFDDYRSTGTSHSAKDGVLTFLWYMQRFIKMARQDYPDSYEYFSNSQSWQKVILTLWDRAWIYLDITSNNSFLGIDDTIIEELVLDNDLIDEIELIKSRISCD